MKKSSKLNTDHFLNRLALDEMTNPDSIDPYDILTDIFNRVKHEELREMFSHLCAAATTKKYSWNKGTPGNILYFCEKFEQIIEACYLILGQGKKKQKKKLRNNANLMECYRFPLLLSANEYQMPILVIEKFFSHQPLEQWKLALHSWMEAGMSNHSVVESVDPTQLLPFVHHMERLIEAAFLIANAINKEKL